MKTLLLAVALIALTLRGKVPLPEDVWQRYGGECGHVSRQFVALAKAIPSESLVWRSAPGARFSSEVLMRMAITSFYLLSIAGPETGNVTAKELLISGLERSLDAVKSAHAALKTGDAIVNGMYILITADANEHTGQVAAYASQELLK